MKYLFLVILLSSGLAYSKDNPVITKEFIQQRIEQHKQEREQAIATANALNGAIQEDQFLLSEMEKTDKTEKKKEAK